MPANGDYSARPPVDASQELATIRRGAQLLDSAIPVPGTSLRFGIDAVIGIVPGLGDAVGAVFASMILFKAYRLGAGWRLLLRMFSNITIDGLLGAVPLLGDWHDLVWKANLKNTALLERHLVDPATTARASGWFLALLLGGVLAIAAASVLVALWVLRWLVGLW
jgi:hypothetical protein